MGRTDGRATDEPQLKTISVTDPAVNAAVSTTIIDTHSGVIITTTTTGNAQTLQTPTNTASIKRFSVINNDTSTDTVTINGTSLGVGEVKYYVWDGSAWVTESASGSGGFLTISCSSDYLSIYSNYTHYIGLGGSSIDSAGSVGDTAIPASRGGVLKNFRAFIGYNTLTEDSTMTIVKNEVDTGILITITAGTTGLFTDLVNTVSVSAGDLLAIKLSSSEAEAEVGAYSIGYSIELEY